jgi:protein-disulfide isomerase
LYALLGLIAVLGGIFLISRLGSTSTVQPSRITIDQAVRPFNAPVGTTPDGFYYKGNPDAPVKVIEYADFQCPGCGYFAREQEAGFTKSYVESGKVQFIYHELPIGQHRNAIPAASAARCAGDQGKFWPMHDALFSRQGEWSDDPQPAQRFGGYAQELGLDQSKFDQCLASGQYTQPINDAGVAAAAAGAKATPTFSVDGKLVTLEQGNELQAAVDAALAAKGQ